MNAFTIPQKSVMSNSRAPVDPRIDAGKHLRHHVITGAKQGQKETDELRKKVLASI